MTPLPFSILDNDLYKFSMQQAVLKVYPQAVVTYEFKNRKPDSFKFSLKTVALLQKRISDLSKLRLTEEEALWLEKNCPYFTQKYIEYLKAFRFKPDEHVTLTHTADDNIQISITGNWADTMLYALVSESFFETGDTDWNGDMLLQYSSALEKGKRLIKAGCIFSEFGTRRRRNAKVQDVVVSALKAASQESVGPVAGTAYFAGTSNVYLAKKYDLSPIGTVAHEWTMAISGIEEEGGDLLHANKNALEKWLEAYPDEFLIALCDTYGTPAFLADFNEELAAKYLGVRQDSGDPELFVDRVVGRYRELGIDPAAKSLIFSDSLNVDKAIKLQRYVDSKKGGGIVAKYGIGTYLTNDFYKSSNAEEKSPAINIVIKLVVANGVNVVKLSDDVGKHQGDPEAIENALKVFGFK